MKILKGILPLVVTITVVWGAEDKPKKIEDKLKKTGKRQIGFGLEAIPGLAFHTPLAEDGLLIAQTTAHGGIGGYGLVQPIGLVHASQADNTGGFASQGFNDFQGGYGFYAPQSFAAAPFLDVQQASKAHQLDGGWKGIDHGHGATRQGHEIVQSLVSRPAAPYQEGIFEVVPIVSQFDFGKTRNALYNTNAFVPTYNGFETTSKGFGPVKTVQQFNNLQQVAFPSDYNFASGHGNPVTQVTPSYHHAPGPLVQNHKGHGSISHGHQLASQGHQLAKKVHIPSGHSGFIGSQGPNVHHQKARLHSHPGKKAAHPSGYSFGLPAPSQQNYYNPPPVNRQNSYAPPAPSRSVAPLSDYASHDSTSHSTSYSTDFNVPKSSYSPDFNPSDGHASSEHSDFSRTNGHGGHYSGEKKATSFQSFIIHSYKPHPTSHKTKYDSLESDENFSGSNYNSAQALSGEKHNF